MSVRLNKVLKELSIGVNTAVEFLQKKGSPLEVVIPNAKITDDQYNLLQKEFGHDKTVSSKKAVTGMKQQEEEKEHPSQHEANDNGISVQSPCITIGNVDVSWQFAVGQYEVLCLQDIPFNAFDKVICGILNNHGGILSKEQLGNIIGFNVIDNPSNWKYKDQAECKILDEAIDSLKVYGIVDDDAINIYLTQIGRDALNSGKKQQTSKENVTLYSDLLTGNDVFASELFSCFSSKAEEFTPEEVIQIDEERIRTNIALKYPNVVDTEKGKTIGKLFPQSVKFFKISVPVDIIYNFVTSSYEIGLNNVNKDLKDLINNIDFRDAVLTEFFRKSMEAIIYKPAIQEELERNLESKGQSDLFVCAQSDFIKNLPHMMEGKLNVVCLFLDEINESVVNKIAEFSANNIDTMVCVEYIKGAKTYNDDYYIRNIGIQQKETLTTRSVCICSDNTYYSEELFVFAFAGKEYQIPVIVRSHARKYRISVIASSFANNILPNMIEEFVKKLNKSDFQFDDNKMSDAATQYANLSNTLSLFPDTDTTISDNLTELWKRHLHNCIINLREEAESISYSNAPQVLSRQMKGKLNALIPIMTTYAPELVDDIKQMEATLPGVTGVTVKTRDAYIVDTNAFISNPKILNDFDLKNDIVYLPKRIYDELDRHTHNNSESLRKAASEALKNINRVRTERPQFLKFEDLSEEDMKDYLPYGYNSSISDNHMLALALKLKGNEHIHEVIIITEDNPFKGKALEEGITVRKER